MRKEYKGYEIQKSVFGDYQVYTFRADRFLKGGFKTITHAKNFINKKLAA